MNGQPTLPPTRALTQSLNLLILGLMSFAFLGGIWLRAIHLNDPMRNDETFSYLIFVARHDLLNYSKPNNHFLNTLLMAWSNMLGGDSPAVLRAPAFFFGVLLMPAIGLLAFQISRCRLAALAAIAFAASAPTLIEYSVNARGYSAVAFMSLAMACLALRLREHPRWTVGWGLWALAAAAGFIAIPAMLIPIASVTALLLLDRWTEVKARLYPLAASLVFAGIVALLVYLPLVTKNGISAIAQNQYVDRAPLATIPGEIHARFQELAAMWRGDCPWAFLLVLCGGALLGLLACRASRGAILASLGVAVALLFAFAQSRVAPARVYTYLLAWMIPCAAASIVIVHRWIGGIGRALGVAAAITLSLIGLWDGFVMGIHPRLLISEDPHTFVEAREVAARLIARGVGKGDIATLWEPAENLWPPLLYYLLFPPA